MCIKSHRFLCHPYRSWECHDSIRYQCPRVSVPKCRRFWLVLIYILPPNLTWNLKMMVSKRNHLFQGLLFRFHVKFQGCNWWNLDLCEARLAIFPPTSVLLKVFQPWALLHPSCLLHSNIMQHPTSTIPWDPLVSRQDFGSYIQLSGNAKISSQNHVNSFQNDIGSISLGSSQNF